MSSKRISNPKRLRQTTLFETTAHGECESVSVISSPSSSLLKRKRTARAATPSSTDDDDLRAIKFEPEPPKLGQSSQKLDSQHHRKKPRRNMVLSSDESSPNHHSDSETDLRARPLSSKRRSIVTIQDSESDSEQVSRRDRRIVKSKLPMKSDEDVTDEVDAEQILDTRLRSRNRMTKFQKNLEKLKRRKQGQMVKTDSESYEEEEYPDDDAASPIQGAKPSSDKDSLFDEDSDTSNSSDFIVKDDNDVQALLPAQFSMGTHEDLTYQFKKIFQFFVHIAVRPACERRDFMEHQLREEQYFSVPLQVTRRKLSGMRDSLVASSVWRPDFKKALEHYPEFDLVPLDFAVPACDACHLGGRLSTLIGRLSGSPYDRLGFVDKDDSDDSDADSDDESSGRMPPVMEFHLGRFCGRRTRVYHDFTHWEYYLFKCILEEVDELHASAQSGGFFRISYNGTKRPPKDLQDADGICDWLDDRKIIDMQWQKIKDMMERARHLDLANKKGEED